MSVEGDELVWRYPRQPEAATSRRLTDRSLLAFSKLADAENPEAIQSFASRYGVLSACQIDPEYKRESDVEVTNGTVWRLGDDRAYLLDENLQGREPLGLWLMLAQQARAILKINAALKGRARRPLPDVGSDEDWAVLGGSPELEDPRDAQFFLRRVVNRWLAIGGIRLELGIAEWSRTRTDWKLDVAYNGLAGALAYRLLLIVIGESNLYACAGCGHPYIRLKRAPQPGQENFCPDCAGIAQKRAVQRFREKKLRKRKGVKRE